MIVVDSWTIEIPAHGIAYLQDAQQRGAEGHKTNYSKSYSGQFQERRRHVNALRAVGTAS